MPAIRTRFAWASVALTLTFVLASALAATGCVGSGKTARADTLAPFPASLHVVSDVTAGCRDGESGFDYRFMIVGPSDLTPGSELLEHIRTHGFFRSDLLLDDLPWVTTAYQHGDYPLRVEAGPLDRYLRNPIARTGPVVGTISQDVRDHASQYALLAMRPTDFACNTPL